MLNHVGKMKNNNAKVIVVFRTLPGDSDSALVIGTNALNDSYHDTIINLVQSQECQQSAEISEIFNVRKFPDGSNILQWLHVNNHLKKVPTSNVIMTPTTQERDQLPLDELNRLLAEQKGIDVADLAVHDSSQPAPKKKESTETTDSAGFDLTPEEMRSRADALFKQAQELRKQADKLDPPKKRTKKEQVDVE